MIQLMMLIVLSFSKRNAVSLLQSINAILSHGDQDDSHQTLSRGRAPISPGSRWRLLMGGGTVSLAALFRGVIDTASIGRLGQPHTAAGAAIGPNVGQACPPRGPRQTQWPRADWTRRLLDVVRAHRPHQVS
jgi:hypothetical protein